MNWTTEAPTQPGYYWLRENGDDEDPMILEVESSDMGLISSCCGHKGFIPIRFCAGEWCGPIAAPLDAGDAAPKTMEVEGSR